MKFPYDPFKLLFNFENLSIQNLFKFLNKLQNFDKIKILFIFIEFN
jgi:hypothetical protein